MTIDRSTALNLWDSTYGKNSLWATDPFGTWMYRDDYGDTNTVRNIRPGSDGKYYNYGWEVDHLKPKTLFNNETEATFVGNLQLMHWRNNREKADNYPKFIVRGKTYEILDAGIYGFYNEFWMYDYLTEKTIDQKAR